MTPRLVSILYGSLLQSSTHPWPLPFFLARLSVRWEISAKSPPQLCVMLGPDWKQRGTVPPNKTMTTTTNNTICQNRRTDYPAIIIPHYQSIAGVNILSGDVMRWALIASYLPSQSSPVVPLKPSDPLYGSSLQWWSPHQNDVQAPHQSFIHIKTSVTDRISDMIGYEEHE